MTVDMSERALKKQLLRYFIETGVEPVRVDPIDAKRILQISGRAVLEAKHPNNKVTEGTQEIPIRKLG